LGGWVDAKDPAPPRGSVVSAEAEPEISLLSRPMMGTASV